MIATEIKNHDCLESDSIPVADNYFYLQDINSYCLESDKMAFMKGYIPWNKGKSSWNKGLSLTDKHKKNLSESHIGQRASPRGEFKKGHKPWNYGRSCSEETKPL